MTKRTLGNTGMEVSVLGFGGFHLIEIPRKESADLLNTYLDRGGNYVETAASYGDGISERKIGEGIGHRRKDFVLATKCGERTKDAYLASVDRSLKFLRTDVIDILFMHGVQTFEDADRILGPGGAMEGAVQAQKAGKIRFIGITGHGRPDVLIYSLKQHRYDVLMTGFNYLDRFNYPTTEQELLPLCRTQGTGLLAMKAVADGYLYRSAPAALRYTLSLPYVASVVAGMNTPEMLDVDFRIANSLAPMTDSEKADLYRTAPELGDYVCRLCNKCNVNGFDPQQVFLLEGLYDRQMDSGRLEETAQYALRERLRFWFAQNTKAREEYAALKVQVDPGKDYSELNRHCPYGIDIDRKLKVAHGKLSGDGYMF